MLKTQAFDAGVHVGTGHLDNVATPGYTVKAFDTDATLNQSRGDLEGLKKEIVVANAFSDELSVIRTR